jgi:hypothetical protein
MRMALDLGLHRALEKLADDSGKKRTEEEERDLGMSILFYNIVQLTSRQSYQLAYGSVCTGLITSESSTLSRSPDSMLNYDQDESRHRSPNRPSG